MATEGRILCPVRFGLNLTFQAFSRHANISMAANAYRRAVESLHQNAASRIDALLGNAVGGALTVSGEGPAKAAGPLRAHGVRRIGRARELFASA